MGIQKLFVLIAALFLFSGCCDLLGICTSASIHTSISGEHQYAQQSIYPGVQMAQQLPQSCGQ